MSKKQPEGPHWGFKDPRQQRKLLGKHICSQMRGKVVGCIGGEIVG